MIKILPFLGSLLPIIFPNQEFKPKRLAAVIVSFILIIGSIKIIGLDETLEAIEATEDLIELTEE